MYKILILLSMFFLTNCTLSGTAFLGPIFTGAKTGSIYQASLSYGTNRAFNEFKEFNSIKESKNLNILNTTSIRNPIILTAFAVTKVEISEVLEPEPLP